ncbi:MULTISPECIES: hypothetical protein [Bradyrhizobium]|jgi:hypothetical protein|uniref:hypothetical protein n=1 Tax=Bradyrhizobium TaxID=374 RepID=UPI0003FA983F|nr:MULTISPECIES: hypothetical protein [Bradyrhizobium]MBK5653090.1 hypothetical protein [Rhizobium sp.]OCX28343.1 hypothetical protein QU42_25125 [Bradyrhizobium sp. UASWS1016]
MIIRSLVLLALTVAFAPVDHALAQAGSVPFPGNGTTPTARSAPAASAEFCLRDFVPLRQDAEAKGKLIKAAADRHAPPSEACKLIGDYTQAEIRMIKYVEANAVQCAIPQPIADRLKAGHKNTETLLRKVCAQARQAPQEPAGPTGDFDHLIDRQIP